MTEPGPERRPASVTGRGDYSFLRRPRWIVGVAIVLIAAMVFVNLGLWQLRRLEERRDRNAVVAARIDREPESLTDVLPGADTAPSDAEWRRVAVTGRYLYEDEVFVRSQTYRGSSGFHVLTPLLLEDGGGDAIIVNRGWIPLDTEGPPTESGATSQFLSATGVLRGTQERGSFGPTDPAEGTLDRMSRVDLARIQQQLDYPIYEMWVQLLRDSDQPIAAGPIPADLPDLGDGPHLSYAGQWFLFTAIVLIGFPALVYRTGRDRPGTPRRANR